MARERSKLVSWGVLLFGLLTLVGYWGPWVPHRAAGLVVLGLDLAELVKFLQPVRSGTLHLWREGFYMPLVAVSAAFSLYAYRRDASYPGPVRLAMVLAGGAAALNLLPPAWSPPLLFTPEFRLQSLIMLGCLGLAAFSPLLGLLPARLPAAATFILAGGAAWFPVSQFLRVLPALEQIYNRPLGPGWGLWLTAGGLLGLAVCSALSFTRSREAREAQHLNV